jgi:hypothetical protein
MKKKKTKTGVSSDSKKIELTLNFNYGDITEEHKRTVEEVIKFLLLNKDNPLEQTIKEIRTRFKIVEVPMMKYEDSLWYQFTKNEKIGNSIQGFKQIKDKNGNFIRIPNIAFSSDLDELDKMLNRFIKIMEYNIKEKNLQSKNN